jgi:methylmalonyl-CoA mutase
VATFADWRAAVDKELKGADFAKTLVAQTPEGIAIEPLYTERGAEPGLPGAAPFVRGSSAAPTPFRIIMRVSGEEDAAAHVEGGADGVWIEGGEPVIALSNGVELHLADPISGLARGDASALLWSEQLSKRGPLPSMGAVYMLRASTIPAHDAGADAADEIAYALSAGVAYLRTLTQLTAGAAARYLVMQVAIGRDTFGEICKLRALRLCWHKILAAAGEPNASPPLIHAVCSSRTEAQRDPWVNLLRGTTQVFAAALGGAEWITPIPFDSALGGDSAVAQRAARNTALVLREESQLGRVIDPAGGSYYVEARTESLARAAWERFSRMERAGGVVALIASGALRARYGEEWAKRDAAIAKRREPVLGVSEFANPEEQLPSPVPPPVEPPRGPALVPHRDGERFEALRARTEGRDVALVTLGPPAEHRARVGFASNFFAAAGIRARETSELAAASVVCLCGSDDRYATDAAAAVAALRAAGAKRIVLAGRMALDGVTNIYTGCDALAVLTELLA